MDSSTGLLEKLENFGWLPNWLGRHPISFVALARAWRPSAFFSGMLQSAGETQLWSPPAIGTAKL
jgi:hypothetical protein